MSAQNMCWDHSVTVCFISVILFLLISFDLSVVCVWFSSVFLCHPLLSPSVSFTRSSVSNHSHPVLISNHSRCCHFPLSLSSKAISVRQPNGDLLVWFYNKCLYPPSCALCCYPPHAPNCFLLF